MKQNKNARKSSHVLSQIRVTDKNRVTFIKGLIELIQNKKFTNCADAAKLLKCSDSFIWKQMKVVTAIGIEKYIAKNISEKIILNTKENRPVLIEMVKTMYHLNPENQTVMNISTKLNLPYNFVYPIVSKCKFEAEQSKKTNIVANANNIPAAPAKAKTTVVNNVKPSTPAASIPAKPTKTINDLKPGDTILVSDDANIGFVKRTFLGIIDGASNGVLFVSSENEAAYRNGSKFGINTASYYKMVPEKVVMSKQDVANLAGVNIDELEIVG